MQYPIFINQYRQLFDYMKIKEVHNNHNKLTFK